MIKEKRFLSMSPDPKFWETNRQILLAGKWCLDPNYKKNFTNLDYKTLENKFFENIRSKEEVIYCNKIYEKTLRELTIVLNKQHKINWSIKAWRIMIGPWLHRSIAIINNRLNIILEAKEKFDIKYKNLNLKNNSLISYNLDDFNKKAMSHEWNEKLLRRLDNILNNKNFEKNSDEFIIEEFVFKKKFSLKRRLINFLKRTSNLFFKNFIFSKKNTFFFNKIYIGSYFITARLFLKLKQFPVRYFFDEDIPINKFNKKIREKINLNLDCNDMKEKIIKYILPELIPTLYIEGYYELLNLTKKQNLPDKKLVIYTCNIWRDSIFKFWVSNKINEGSKLIYGQHGAGFGLVNYLTNAVVKNQTNDDIHDIEISDHFVSWGYKSENNKVISGIVNPAIKFNKINNFKNKNSNILLIPSLNEFYIYRNESKNPNLIWQNIKELSNFIKTVEPHFSKQILLKPHPLEYKRSFSYSTYISEYDKLKICKTSDNLDSLIKNSKISIFFYLGTDFLKNLTLNRPSIAIITQQLEDNLTPQAKIQLKLLSKLKIVFFNSIEAANFLIQNYNNLDSWWNSQEIQNGREKFTNKFAILPENPLDNLSNILRRCEL